MANFGKRVLLNAFGSQLSCVLSSVCCLISPRFVDPVVGKDALAPMWAPEGWSEFVFSGIWRKSFVPVVSVSRAHSSSAGPVLEHAAHSKMGSGVLTPWKTKYLHFFCACTPCSSVIPLR